MPYLAEHHDAQSVQFRWSTARHGGRNWDLGAGRTVSICQTQFHFDCRVYRTKELLLRNIRFAQHGAVGTYDIVTTRRSVTVEQWSCEGSGPRFCSYRAAKRKSLRLYLNCCPPSWFSLQVQRVFFVVRETKEGDTYSVGRS